MSEDWKLDKVIQDGGATLTLGTVHYGEGEKVQPPSVVTEPLSDNKHFATADCPTPPTVGCESSGCADEATLVVYWPGQTRKMCALHAATAANVARAMGFAVDMRMIPPYEAPALTPIARSLEAHVVESTSRPGELSLRLHADDDTWKPFLDALRAAGFRPGDAIRILAVRR